ncbi:MAG: hypothetical protein ACYC7D_13720 [Nitrososphaerales archaeon]
MEIAAKRSTLERGLSNSQKTVSFLSLVNSTLGSVNVNFDAETESESLDSEDYGKIYDLGVAWSETFQASPRNGCSKLSDTCGLLKSYGKLLSANLVIGNAAYGLRPSHRMLENAGTKLALISKKEMKLGAEGSRNGRRAIDLAARTKSTAYILHTPIAPELMRYARSKNVKFALYTLCRIADTESLASIELMRIKGTSYFERRGVLRDNISTLLDHFALYGTRGQFAEKIRNVLDLDGASKVVLYPVFDSFNDLLGQLRILSKFME